ncbi:TetR/AcrR family transcriptional regulator [Mycobacterium sp.]|uniref:TetR/AcrR family transcriptional regulator n=1 Tax=Mycobacterium sp. TaxID=1785 RepID=UPI0025EB6BC7|nr:TetR/AcrR family transcriptional regulator [Mycobacterium sp.]
MTPVLAGPGRSDVNGLSKTRQRICAAALRCFALHGPEGSSMRMVAEAAGVSIGLVQHHFGTKSALIAAVDDELVAVIEQAAPLPQPAPDPVADTSRRISVLIAEHPDAVGYLSRLLIDDKPTGRRIFDMLFGIGQSHWDYFRHHSSGSARADPTWEALNPLIMVLGTLILRRHIERQLCEPLESPKQLRTWETAVGHLIAGGRRRRQPSA